MNELYLNCEYYCEVILFRKNEDKEVEVSIYEYKNNQASFVQRLRYIYRIIKYGTPYGDQIILSDKNCKKLVNFLKEKNK